MKKKINSNENSRYQNREFSISEYLAFVLNYHDKIIFVLNCIVIKFYKFYYFILFLCLVLKDFQEIFY